MGTANVWILGGYQSDFARNFTREGHDFADLTAEVVDNTLAAARVDAADIGVIHVANAFGEMFARQGHLGAMPASVNDGLWDTPASRHEAACGFPSVFRTGIPAYRQALEAGLDGNAASIQALFALIEAVDDSTVLYRGGLSAGLFVRRSAAAFLARGGCAREGWFEEAVITGRTGCWEMVLRRPVVLSIVVDGFIREVNYDFVHKLTWFRRTHSFSYIHPVSDR